jgi:hypothetical protein
MMNTRMSDPALRAKAANPGAAPDDRFQAARMLIDRGFGAEAFAAVQDIASVPGQAPKFRLLRLYSQYVEKTVAWLDFTGTGRHAGRWATLDGRTPGASGERSGVLLWLHPGATRAVLVFSNVAGGFGAQTGWHSIGAIHRVLKLLATNIIYMYDDQALLHFGGVTGLGSDYAGCIGGLRALLEARGWPETYTFGASAGGFSALRYGLELESRAILSMSGPTTLYPPDLTRQSPWLHRFHRELGEFAVDLLPLFRAHARRPHLLLCYGEVNSDDARHARRMAELPEAELIPFQGYAEHSTFIESMRNRSLGALVQRLLDSRPAP